MKRPKRAVENSSDVDRGELVLRSMYGEDARNPLLWQLVNAREHLEISQKLDDPKIPLILSLVQRALRKGGNSESVHFSIATGFFEDVANAVMKRDVGFFKDVARLLGERVGGEPHLKMDLIVQTCFTILRARSPSLPTKKAIRDMALRWLAEQNILNRGGKQRNFFDMMQPSVRAEVETELKLLQRRDQNRQWNWTQIFKRCCLSDLPSDKGGKPSHRTAQRS